MFDVHTHAFHPKIALKASQQLETHYHIHLTGDGTFADLKARLLRAQIDYCCVHSAATKAEQVEPANRWAVSLLKEPGVIPFGTMHPDYHDMDKELAFLWDNGIRGIKLHPDFQGFRLDDPRLDALFGAIAGHFTLMLHIGDVLPPKENATCPYKAAAVKRKFPKLQMIAAHFGGVHHWPYVIDAMRGLDMYFDTSSTLWGIKQKDLEEIFNAFPHDHFFFGSDYPLFDPGSEMIELQKRLKLTDSQLEAIMTNAKVLGLFENRLPLSAVATETAR